MEDIAIVSLVHSELLEDPPTSPDQPPDQRVDQTASHNSQLKQCHHGLWSENTSQRH